MLVMLLLIEFPFYIEAPGGIINVDKRINIDNAYKSSGSLNLSYITEYKATIPTLIMSLFNNDYEVKSKNDVIPDNINVKDYEYRDRLMLEEAYSNAIYVGYTKANKDIKVNSEKIYVNYIFDEAITDLQVGDQILKVNDILINSKDEIDKIVSDYKVGDTFNVKVIRNNKENIKTVKLISYKNSPIIGIIVSKIKKMDTSPKISLNYKERESGPSGGLMLALAIYNSLTKKDITKGRVIVGTGTIDEDGTVGSIGGVEYKLKGAVKSKASIFLVPNGENYKTAMKLKKKNNYKIKIKGVSTFEEALDFLIST